MDKGSYGYMNNYKMKHGIALLIYAVIIGVLIVIGKLNVLDNVTVSAVLVVLAILMVLPAAKHFIAAIIVISYKSATKSDIDYFDEITKDIKTGISIYDLTLSSEEKIYYTPYIYVNGNNLYCLYVNVNKAGMDTIKSYINKILYNHGYDMNIIMCKDVESMNKALSEAVPDEDQDDKALNNLKELLLGYNV